MNSLFVLLLILKTVYCQLWVKVYTVHSCEGHNLTLYCNIDDEIIVTVANYGRMNYKTCQFFEIPDKGDKINCRARSSVNIMREKCNGKNRCTVVASNSIFGDPCPGEIKYLETSYFCRKPLNHQIVYNDTD